MLIGNEALCFFFHLKMFDLKEDGKFKYLVERELRNIKGTVVIIVWWVLLLRLLQDVKIICI